MGTVGRRLSCRCKIFKNKKTIEPEWPRYENKAEKFCGHPSGVVGEMILRLSSSLSRSVRSLGFNHLLLIVAKRVDGIHRHTCASPDVSRTKTVPPAKKSKPLRSVLAPDSSYIHIHIYTRTCSHVPIHAYGATHAHETAQPGPRKKEREQRLSQWIYTIYTRIRLAPAASKHRLFLHTGTYIYLYLYIYTCTRRTICIYTRKASEQAKEGESEECAARACGLQTLSEIWPDVYFERARRSRLYKRATLYTATAAAALLYYILSGLFTGGVFAVCGISVCLCTEPQPSHVLSSHANTSRDLSMGGQVLWPFLELTFMLCLAFVCSCDFFFFFLFECLFFFRFKYTSYCKQFWKFKKSFRIIAEKCNVFIAENNSKNSVRESISELFRAEHQSEQPATRGMGFYSCLRHWAERDTEDMGLRARRVQGFSQFYKATGTSMRIRGFLWKEIRLKLIRMSSAYASVSKTSTKDQEDFIAARDRFFFFFLRLTYRINLRFLEFEFISASTPQKYFLKFSALYLWECRI